MGRVNDEPYRRRMKKNGTNRHDGRISTQEKKRDEKRMKMEKIDPISKKNWVRRRDLSPFSYRLLLSCVLVSVLLCVLSLMAVSSFVGDERAKPPFIVSSFSRWCLWTNRCYLPFFCLLRRIVCIYNILY